MELKNITNSILKHETKLHINAQFDNQLISKDQLSSIPQSEPDLKKFIRDLWKQVDKSHVVQPPAHLKTFKAGEHQNFWVWDLSVMPPGFKQVNATCRSVGESSYIFVDDASWGKTATKDDIEKIHTTFNKQTPPASVEPDKGIYHIDTKYFGEPPDIDKNPKIFLLVTDFGQFKGTSFDGYFNPFDQMDDKSAWEQYQQHSNECEIVYLNSASPTTPISSDYMLAVAAHEFQHLIHFNYDQNETSWLNESCGEAAMTLCGYYTDKKHVKRYTEHPSNPLVSLEYVDYGACLLWATYLNEQLGKDFFRTLVKNKEAGVVSVNEALKEYNSPHTFDSILSNWVAANYASSKGVKDPKFHYNFIDVPPMKLAAKWESYPAQYSSSLKHTGVNYISLGNPTTGKISLQCDGENQNPKVGMEVLYINGEQIKVEKLDLSTGPKTIDTSLNPVLAVYGLSEKETAQYTIRANTL